MIDTLKFKVVVNDKQNKLIQNKCAILEKSKQKETIFKFVTDNMKLGSYERNVHIQLDDNLGVFIEFSAPKYVYGHNVYLLYPSQIKQTLKNLHKDLETYFGSFPSYEKWILYRLDLCYSWRLKDQEAVTRVMTLLHSFAYPRKEPYKRGTSIMFIGSAYSVKFYQKHEEFIKHDFKEIRKNKSDTAQEFADEGLKLSSGVLRFEASLKRPIIKQEFGEHANFEDLLDNIYLTEKLNYYLKKYFRNLDLQLMTTKEIHTRLITTHGKTRGVQLFQFYVSYFTEKKLHRDLLTSSYSRTQIQKNLRDIRKAKVGISKESLKIEFDFNIPSKDVVNTDDLSSAEGKSSKKSGYLVTPTL